MLIPFLLAVFGTTTMPSTQPFMNFVLDYDTPVDAASQQRLEAIDADLRKKFDMQPTQAACGVLDLEHNRLAMIFPDREEYAASVAKIGILLAYFQLHPEAATNIDPTAYHELGLMCRPSSNEMASKYSHELGLSNVQKVLNDYDLYNQEHGGGIWVGKHYGRDTEKHMSPTGDNSHGITVRQVLRYFLWLEQGKLVSPAASAKMREIFAEPDIPADDIKFVKAMKGRDVQIIRKWGTWDDWHHDSAVITGPGRHYILVGITNHPKGDDYLEGLATAVDDWMSGK